MEDFARYRSSALPLIAANLLPLLGVLFLGWDAFAVVALYWAENLVIGAINVLKLITCSPDASEIDWSKVGTPEQVEEMQSQLAGYADKAKLAHHASKLFFVPFFVVHYGGFCFVHGIFVLVLFGHDRFTFSRFGELSNFAQVFTAHHLWWAIAVLAASHVLSFFVNYLSRSEYRRTLVPQLMIQPYARVVVLHLAILFGGFVAMALGSNAGVLTILIAGKTALDLKLHLQERRRNAGEWRVGVEEAGKSE